MSNQDTNPHAQNTTPNQPHAYDAQAIGRARSLLDAVPDQVGPYRVLERIGGGGMGEVYRAEQRSPIRREVALKLIKLGMDTKLVIARFEAERQALAMMDHPNIARVYDANADDTGRPYFVMELVRGTPITDYADEHKLTLRARLDLFLQVCAAVQHAHQKGVIHRDLKPNNVLVSTQDGRPHAKVIDFGIAKATSSRLTDKTLFTEFANFIGTPQYMSPEQANGSLDIDTRSDVYSLGVLLYELLTGQTPFDGETLKRAAIAEIARIIKDVEPPRPSSRLSAVGSASEAAGRHGVSTDPQPTTADPRSALVTLAKSRSLEPNQLVKQVRGELDWLVMKAMEKDRARRYETPTGLAEDVRRYLDGSPVHAAPPSAAYRARKFVRKHRGPVIIAAVLAAMLTTGLTATTWQWRRANQNAERAVASERAATTQQAEASRQRDAAELEAYIANLALARGAMENTNWPEARERLDACSTHMRGFEWRFLRARADTIQFTFPVTLEDPRFDLSGRFIIGSHGGERRVYGIDGKLVARLAGGSVYFSSSGQTCAIRSDKGVYCYTVPYGKQIAFIEKSVAVLAQSDDSVMVRTDSGVSLHFHSTSSRNASGAIPLSDVDEADFLADGGIVTLQNDGSLIIRSSDGRPLKVAVPAGSAIAKLQVVQGGRAIATRSRDGEATLFDTRGTKVVTCASVGDPAISFLELKGDLLAIKHASGGLSVWDDRGMCLFKRDGDAFQRITAKAKSGFLAAHDYTGLTRLIDPRSGRTEAQTYLDVDRIDPASRRILSDGYRPNTVGISDFDGRVVGDFPLDAESSLTDVSGDLVVVHQGYYEGPVSLTSFSQLNAPELTLKEGVSLELAAIEAAEQPLRESGSTGSPIEPRLSDGTVTFIDSGGIGKTLSVPPTTAICTLTADATRLVTADARQLRFWDTKTGRELCAIGIDQLPERLQFTSSGTRLLMFHEDASVGVWDVRGREERQRERDVRFEQQPAAERIVQALWESDVPLEKMAEKVQTDSGITPLLRAAAYERLHSRHEHLTTGIESYRRDVLNIALSADRARAAVQTLPDHRLRDALLAEVATLDLTDDRRRANVRQVVSARDCTPGQYQAALASIHAILERNPNDPTTLECLGLALYRTGNPVGAIGALEAYERKAPADDRLNVSRLYRAMAYQRLGQVEKAEATLRATEEAIVNEKLDRTPSFEDEAIEEATDRIRLHVAQPTTEPTTQEVR